MYSLPENIEMSRYGREVFMRFAELMDVAGAPGVFPYREHGYLYLAAGAVAPVPLRLRRTEQLLEGAELDEKTIRLAGDLAMVEVAPITDVRTTAEYRRHITGVFVRRGLTQLLAEGGGA